MLGCDYGVYDFCICVLDVFVFYCVGGYVDVDDFDVDLGCCYGNVFYFVYVDYFVGFVV